MSAAIIESPRFVGARSTRGTRTGDVQGSGRSVPPRLRMTRRGRVVLAVVIALPLAFGAGMAFSSADGAVATADSSSSSFEYVQVEAGQSLWQIASAVAPADDPRDVVSEIVRLNGLASSDVFPGQRLGIPEQYRS